MTKRRDRLRTALEIRPGERLVVRAELYGARPVYFGKSESGVASVSPSIGALSEQMGGLGQIDRGALERTMLGWPRSDETLFTRVHRVPPGKEARFEPAAVVITEPERAPLAEVPATPEGLLALLREVVDRHARPAGTACALSGGLDSATLLTLLAERSDEPILAVSLSDGGGDDPELIHAREVAARCGARHEVVEVDSSRLPQHFEAAVLACEAPLFNARAVAKCELWRRVAELTSSPVLSGVGADEVMFGHPAVLAARQGSAAPFEAALEVQRELAAELLPGVERPGHETCPPDAVAWAGQRFVDHVLPGHTIPLESPAGAAHGVDVRLPFLDEAFARWALGLQPAQQVRPWPFTSAQLLAGGVLGKVLLRDALGDRLPASVRLHPKVPRLAPSGGPDGATRQAWWEVYARALDVVGLERLPGVDGAAVNRLLDGYRGLVAGPGLEAADRVLMQLASVVILSRELG